MNAESKMRRRDFLRALGAGAGAGAVVTTSGMLVEKAAADSESNDEKRKPRYQANSPDVQAYYRVNRYPER
jgi:hypothetical protein